MALILEAVSRRFTVTRDDILGVERHRSFVHARQVAAWLIRRKGLSYPEIGRALRRDHTTIMYAVARVQALFDVEPGVAESLLELERVASPRTEAVE